MFGGEDGCACSVLSSLVADGVPVECITTGTVRMTTESFAIIRDATESGPAVIIADIARQSVSRQGSSGADAAVMCPNDRMMAMQSDKAVQVFDLTEKKRVGSCELPARITFLTWISDTKLALVSKTHLYHWDSQETAKPKKMFEKSSDVDRISYYTTDETFAWLLAGGAGQLQLYSVEKKGSKSLEGQTGVFCVVDGQTILAVVNGARLTTIELPTGRKQTTTYEKKVAELPLTGDDEVITLLCHKGGFLSALSRDGCAFLVDVHTNTLLYKHKPATEKTYITAAPVLRKGEFFFGFVGIERGGKGNVVQFEFDMEYIVPNIVRPQHGEAAALDIAGRANLKEAITMYSNRFKSLVASGSVQDAIALAIAAPNNCLRTLETVRSLQGFPQIPGEAPVVMVYFQKLLDTAGRTLNAMEGLELAKIVFVKQDGAEYVGGLIRSKKLTPSEELGERLEEIDQNTALHCYSAAACHTKAIALYIKMRNFSSAVKYIEAKMDEDSWSPDWEGIVTSLIASNPEGAVEFCLLLLNTWRVGKEKEKKRKTAALTPLAETPVAPALVVDYFVDRGCIKEATKYLLSVLDRKFSTEAEEKAEEGYQTKLFEMNLKHSAPTVIEALFTHGKFTNYNYKKIAALCEKAGMYQRSLKLYTKAHLQFYDDEDSEGEGEGEGASGEIDGIVRCGINTAGTAGQWLPDILNLLTAEDGMQLIQALLASNARQHAAAVSDSFTASKHSAPLLEKYDANKLTAALAEHQSFDALYAILSRVAHKSTDTLVHTKFIESCVVTGHVEELEACTRESKWYDADLVLACLSEARLNDPWPFINVCQRHLRWDQLVSHLVSTRNLRYLDLFLGEKADKKTNATNAPAVVSALLDAAVDEHFIFSLIQKIKNCPASGIVTVVQEKGRIAFVTPWLEELVAEGVADAVVIEALARHYIEVGVKEKLSAFLTEQQGKYNGKAIGAFAEERGLYQVAYQAYSTSLPVVLKEEKKGLPRTDSNMSDETFTPTTPTLDLPAVSAAEVNCDDNVLQMCTAQSLMKELGQYLVSRQSIPMWSKALSPSSYRESLVDALVGSVLPHVTDPRQLSFAVKAFTQSGMPERLTQVLEDLVLNNPASPFCHNRYLQNLLLLTIVQTQPANVMSYVRRMDKYDTEEMASIMLKKNLNEEALEIYRLSKKGNEKAMRLLTDVIKDMTRAQAFAEEVDVPAVWLILGETWLAAKRLQNAMQALSKAEECTHTRSIVQLVEAEVKGGADVSLLTVLIDYLQASRAACNTGDISFLTYADTETVYYMGRVEQFSQLTQKLSTPHLANLTKAGERCFAEGLYEAARVLFTADRNYARLSSALLKMSRFLEALDAAQKAASIKTWKDVCFTCVQHGELHLAQMSAQHLIIVPDEVDTVFDFFKRAGKIVELQKLLRTGLTHERTHTGIYTALARLLCLYDAAQLLEFLHLHWAKIQRGVILPLCEQERLWAEVAYLQRCDDEHARALGTMLDHPARAWTHTDFVSSAQKTTVTDVIYSGVTFYADNHPELLPDYLLKLTERVSPDKVVLLLESAAQDSKVFIARDWLMSVQKHDTKILNNCINGMLVEEEDYEALRKSLELYRNFDRVGLCSTLVTHSLMELRRVASWIHAESGRHQDAVDIALKDKLYVDATHFAAASGDADVVHKLLDYFISNSLNECFAAALYTCYEHIQPDVAMELAWRHKQHDTVMPYLCQVLRELWDFKKQHSRE